MPASLKHRRNWATEYNESYVSTYSNEKFHYRYQKTSWVQQKLIPRIIGAIDIQMPQFWKHNIYTIIFLALMTAVPLVYIITRQGYRSIPFYQLPSTQISTVHYQSHPPRSVNAEIDVLSLHKLNKRISKSKKIEETAMSQTNYTNGEKNKKDSHHHHHHNYLRSSPTSSFSGSLHGCEVQYLWQLSTYTSCNILHEIDMTCHERNSNVELLTNGYFRDVWKVTEGNPENTVVLKTLRYQHEFKSNNYDRHRRDATAMERLSNSQNILDIYGFCGNSGLFEYAPCGDLISAIWPLNETKLLTRQQKLIIATQTATAIATVHNIDMEGTASIVHTDITPGQFVLSKAGVFKLNDFNRARFIHWSRSRNKTCGYFVGKNPGKNRSPEEYMHKMQDEKVDIFSLGNIYYMLLQEEWPFQDIDEADAIEMVKQGYRPSFYENVWNSTDPVDQALKQAMIMCHQQDPKERSSAREVELFLKERASSIYPNWTIYGYPVIGIKDCV